MLNSVAQSLATLKPVGERPAKLESNPLPMRRDDDQLVGRLQRPRQEQHGNEERAKRLRMQPHGPAS